MHGLIATLIPHCGPGLRATERHLNGSGVAVASLLVEAAGTALIGISPDSVKSHDKFKLKRGLDVTLASDESKSVVEAYGVWQEKQMCGRSYMGVVRATMLIDAEGRIARIWPGVKVKGHVAEVLAAAGAL